MSLIEMTDEHDANPVDVIETVAALHDWYFERTGEHEITVSVKGQWSDYHISFSWMYEFEALHLACGFDLKVMPTRELEVLRLIALINEQLWLGHFDVWREENVILYRSALLLSGGLEPSQAQVAELLATAVDACERYYQAFQFTLWGGKQAKEAVATALFETVGQA